MDSVAGGAFEDLTYEVIKVDDHAIEQAKSKTNSTQQFSHNVLKKVIEFLLIDADRVWILFTQISSLPDVAQKRRETLYLLVNALPTMWKTNGDAIENMLRKVRDNLF